MKCYWWNRWYHRRQREIDVDILFQEFDKAAERKLYMECLQGTLIWKERKEILVSKAIRYHKEGEKHWNCQCAKEDENDMLRMFPRIKNEGQANQDSK